MLQVFRTRPRRRARLSIERAELVLPLQHTAGRQKRTQQRVITEHLVLFAIYHYIYLLLRLIPDCPKREDTLHLGTRVCAVPCSWMVPLVWRARKITIFFSASATRASRGRPTYVLRPEERYTQRRRMRLVQTVPRAAADALRYPTLRGPTATEVAAERDYRMSIMYSGIPSSPRRPLRSSHPAALR